MMKLPRPGRDVVYQSVSDGAVLLSTSTEVYFGLNEVGARIWQLLPPQSETLDDLCATLVKEYEDADRDQIREDVVELLESLVENGLVDPTPEESEEPALQAAGGGA